MIGQDRLVSRELLNAELAAEPVDLGAPDTD